MWRFGKSIDTNNNFSRIIFDSWLEVRFPKPLEALKTLYQATKIRSMWQKFLTAKLLEQDNVNSEQGNLFKGIVICFIKGQLISKCLFGVFNSPKKLMKTIRIEVP